MLPAASPTWLAWTWPITGWTLVALGAALLLWALFTDRGGRRKRRCPRCWYDMTGIVALTCPECGHAARNERALFRTRRRRQWAAAALLLALVGTQVADQPRRTGERWTRAIPSTVLALLARHGDQGWYAALPFWRKQVQSAAWNRPMAGWQRALSERVALPIDEDDIRSMFVSRWAWSAGEIETVCVLVPDEALGVMGGRKRSVTITSLSSPGVRREIDASFYVLAERNYWRDRWSGSAFDLGPGRLVAQFQRPTRDFVLPTRPVGDYVERFEVVLRNAEGWTIGRWTVEFPSRVVATPEETIADVDSPELVQDLITSITVNTSRQTSSHRDAQTTYALKFAESIPSLGAFPFAAEVFVDGRHDCDVDANGVFALPTSVDPGRVLIRLRSDRSAACANRRSLAFWTGAADLPLTALTSRR